MVADGVASAALALVATPGEVLEVAAAGAIAPGEGPPDLDTRFDLASLTKPIVATLAHALDRRDALPWRSTVGRWFPEARPRLRRRRMATLLRHRAGLLPWTPLSLRLASPSGLGDFLCTSPNLLGAPMGTYSDLGYMLWGLAAERATGRSLAGLLEAYVLAPLGMTTTAPQPGAEGDVADCALDNAVEIELAAAQGFALPPVDAPGRGRVQDGNARFLGGLAGHAGLFGSANDLHRFAAAWLEPRGPLDTDSVARALAGRGPFAAGWARRRIAGSAGAALPASAFGHTGFVGHALWIDPERRRIYLWLAHRRRADPSYGARRRAFHRQTAGL